VSTPQDQFNGAFKEGQDILTQAVTTWQEAVTNAAGTMAQNVQKFGNGAPGVCTPQVSTAIVENVFDFAEQLLRTQRQFAKTLLESGIPAVEAANRSASAAGDAVQQAAKDSVSAVQSAANSAAESTKGSAAKK
jgi:hypothetical protein